MSTDYLCERCRTAAAIKGERYCRLCRAEVIKKMKDAGYLQTVYSWHKARPPEARENTNETKHGTGHG